jgi:aspartate/methionine/tyrosine aminotransferase
MKIESFLLERWMTRHETHVRYDIAESGILPLSTDDLLNFEPPDRRQATLDRLLRIPLGYSEARGTIELRTMLADTYTRGDADHILVTTGAIEANFLLYKRAAGCRRSRDCAVPGVSAALQRAEGDWLRYVVVEGRT